MTRESIILVVDDDELLREVAGEFLSEAGYIVHVAASGEEGLRFFSDNTDKIDLVISDMGLPGMTGADLLRSVLKIRPQTNILAMSGFGGQEMLEEVNKLGSVGFLPKPFSREDLLAMVASSIKGER